MTYGVLSAAAGALLKGLGRLPGAALFEGARAVARRELVANLKSLRMVVVTVLLFLAIVGGAAGISAFAGGPGAGPQTGPFLMAHPIWPDGPNSTAGALVFVADVWGTPRPGLELSLQRRQGPVSETIANASTDADGFARFVGLAPGEYMVAERVGGQGLAGFSGLVVPPAPDAFSTYMAQVDVAGNGSTADIVLHAVDASGAPLSGVAITLNGTAVAAFDGRGFAHLAMPPGEYVFEIAFGGTVVQFFAHVNDPRPSFLSGGATIVMAAVALAFVPLIVPIVTIAVAHDAIARERVQGSLDAMLSRPTTRYGVLLGKFAGSLTALALPLYGALSVGALVIGAITGKGIDGAFFAAILLAVTAYVAAYTLLLLILSSIAKTTGTAVMFGVLLWLVYNFLWGVVTLLVTWAAGLSPVDRGYYEVEIYSGLLNLNNLYIALLTISYPGGGSNSFTFQGQELLPSWAPLVAYGLWLAVLFSLALWVFERKAAE